MEDISMNNDHMQINSCKERELRTEEKYYLEKMTSVNFLGRDILSDQIQSVKVVGYCNCGCRSIHLQVNRNLPSFQYKIRVPVEMIVESEEDIPIVFLLHIIEGYLDELEVFKADSSPIVGNIDIDNSNSKVSVNEELIISE